ncbi:unnamed protein product [Caenorhabditis brenneri]
MNTSYNDLLFSQFHTRALYLIGTVTLPIHLFGAYCILFQTPDTMKRVKWVMLNQHFWCCLLDLWGSFLGQPYECPPIWGGTYPHLRDYDHPAHPIYVVANDEDKMAGIRYRMLVSVVFYLLDIWPFFIMLHYKMKKAMKEMTMSANTIEAHKVFLRAINMQVWLLIESIFSYL